MDPSSHQEEPSSALPGGEGGEPHCPHPAATASVPFSPREEWGELGRGMPGIDSS